MQQSPEEQLCVRLTVADHDLILEHVILLVPVFSRVNVAVLQSDDIVLIRLTPAELDDLLGSIAAAANHTSSKRLERQLDALYDRVQEFEDSST